MFSSIGSIYTSKFFQRYETLVLLTFAAILSKKISATSVGQRFFGNRGTFERKIRKRMKSSHRDKIVSNKSFYNKIISDKVLYISATQL